MSIAWRRVCKVMRGRIPARPKLSHIRTNFRAQRLDAGQDPGSLSSGETTSTRNEASVARVTSFCTCRALKPDGKSDRAEKARLKNKQSDQPPETAN
jgi:hypothetical protein